MYTGVIWDDVYCSRYVSVYACSMKLNDENNRHATGNSIYSALSVTLLRIYVHLHALCVNGDLIYWQYKEHTWDNIGYSI